MNSYDTFKAIADQTRRDIYKIISEKNGLTINQIADNFNISSQGVTKHLKMLESSGLVKIEKFGRQRKCYTSKAPLLKVKNWIGNFEN